MRRAALSFSDKVRRFSGPTLLHATMILGCGAARPEVAEPAPPSHVSAITSDHEVPTSTPAPSDPLLPELYAALFEQGRRWSLRVVSTSTRSDPTPAVDREESQAACTVAVVRRFAWGYASRLDCDGLEAAGVPEPLGGWWIASSAGLQRSDVEPSDELPKLAPERLVLGRHPKAGKSERPDKEPDFGSSHDISNEGDTWCSEHRSWGGDEGWATVCIAPDRGITLARWGWAGGMTQEREATQLK
jgi:hypothetical protein